MPLDPAVEFEFEQRRLHDPNRQAGGAGQLVGSDRSRAQASNQPRAVVPGLGGAPIGSAAAGISGGAVSARPSKSISSQ